MQSAAVAATGFTNRGLVDRPNLYVLKHTNMPACLIEYGFISNRKESARMKANTSAYGKALYKAVVNLMKNRENISTRLFIEHIDIYGKHHIMGIGKSHSKIIFCVAVRFLCD